MGFHKLPNVAGTPMLSDFQWVGTTFVTGDRIMGLQGFSEYHEQLGGFFGSLIRIEPYQSYVFLQAHGRTSFLETLKFENCKPVDSPTANELATVFNTAGWHLFSLPVQQTTTITAATTGIKVRDRAQISSYSQLDAGTPTQSQHFCDSESGFEQ